MFKRLLVAAATAMTALALLVIPAVGTAGAQVCPSDSPGCEEILPDETGVLPDVDTPDSTPSVDVGGNNATDPKVLGVTTSRSGALPFTGSSIGAAAVIGLGLTGAGIAFAATARRRRTRLETTS